MAEKVITKADVALAADDMKFGMYASNKGIQFTVGGMALSAIGEVFVLSGSSATFAVTAQSGILGGALIAHGMLSDVSKAKKAIYTVLGFLVEVAELTTLIMSNQSWQAMAAVVNLSVGSVWAFTGHEMLSKGKATLNKVYTELKRASGR